MTDAELFHAAHPYYDSEHVQYIARRMAERSIPLCEVCVDWHLPEEEHSMVEEDLR